MPINVKSAGLSTTVQDLGRPGYYHLGIPLGGAMDRFALRVANLLVGNPEGAAGLEAVFMGPELEFTEDATISVTGGELPPLIDGTKCDTWTTLSVKAGQVLSFDYIRSGARACIAVSGGIDTRPALGSRSTYAIGALGGFKGRAIQPGDILPVGQAHKTMDSRHAIPGSLRRQPGASAELRVVTGLYSHRVTQSSLDRFFDETWKVAPEADRMGYRFEGGTQLEFIERNPPFGAGSDPSNITDACYPYGSIQVPSGTEPIILHRDAVSGGGYFMIGTVISADMDLIGQLQPYTQTRFIRVDMPAALSARRDRARRLDEVRQHLA